MQGIIHALKETLSSKNFPRLTVAVNLFWGFALGKILITPGTELGGSILIKTFLIVGACLFANYLMCLRKALKGINRNSKGKLRPFLKDAILCAVLNACVFLFSLSLFFIKPHLL